ncbi:hypothetical protein HLB23_25145 [Nocardia uniformis]|uniref:Uncharacterized protein n=1 Tax=Nocardia uniformis TaxID=53432 RepID=A0A849C5P8_9NOCA|nr:hypothetical protein [Nocardia uniformis]NNH73108.1 hypothetical protein [Nocardia uniformis]
MVWGNILSTRPGRASAGVLTAVVLSAAVTGCAGNDDAATETTTSTGVAVAAPITTTSTVAPSGVGFDPESVPLSEVALGTFPYFAIPAGFENPNKEEPIADRDRVPMWTGDRIEWVIGKVYQSIIHAEEDRAFSKFALLEAIEKAVTDVGGVQVTESKFPSAVADTIDRDIRVAYSSGLGNIYGGTVTTYLVRQSDRRIWVHLSADSAGGSWMIAEEEVEADEN